MESFLLDDIGSVIQNKAIERIISPMTLQLCHLIISMERRHLESEVFTSLEKLAGELAQASEEFIHVAKRLAGDSEEEWLQEEMEPAAESLILSGKNMTLVAQKLHLQPECQSHQEELVTTAQQILVATTKVRLMSELILLLEDAAMVRKTVRTVGWCLTFLDALEEAVDTASSHRLFADLAAALLRLGGLTARWRGERLGRARCLLRGSIPALVAAFHGHLRSPRDPQLAASRRHIFAQTRKTLGEVLAQLEPGLSAPAAAECARNGALTWSLRQLGELLATPGPVGPLGGPLDAHLASVVWHCMRLAAWSAPPERLRLVAGCHQVLELRSAGVRPLRQITRPLGTGLRSQDPGAARAALRAATEALSQGVSNGLLRQILDTFTDTQSPLQRLVQAALVTSPVSSSCNGRALSESLQLFLAAFHDQAKQMLRVAHLVLVCCPQQQTGKDMEVTMASLWGLVVRAQQLFSQRPQGFSVDWSPATLQALLQAWARVSESLLACFDDVLNIPEFLSVSIQEMTKHLDFLTWTLRSGDARGFSTHVAYLQGRAAHIVQVMNRYVGQHRDPIFRNGLRVLIQQLEQSSLVLGAEHCSGSHNSQDSDAFLMVAKQLVCSAQSIQIGLDGTNHPPILSPLRDLVQRFDIAKGQSYFILSSLQDSEINELKHQRGTGLGEHDPGTSYPPRDYLFCPLISDIHPQRRDSPVPGRSKFIFALESYCQQAVTTASPDLWEQDAATDTAQEALAAKGPLKSERRTKLQEIPALAPSIIDLGSQIVHCTTAQTDRLLEEALKLPGSTRETTQSLIAIAGDWYPLCRQLFWQSPDNDFPGNMRVFMELQQNLASVVQLATKSESTDLGKDDPDSTEHPEALLQIQGRLKEAEIYAKQLLDKVWAFDGLQVSKLWDESIEDRCLLWSVAVQDLLQHMGRLSRRQGLFLLPLRQAVKDQQRMQEGLAQAADVSQRLQEAARLSSLLCEDKQVKGELSFLCGEIHVLTEALLDVAQILASSPTPSPSLSTRFELLSLELTLQAKALTAYISSINIDYEHTFQDALHPRLSVCKDPQTRQENSLQRMVSGIQAVQGIVAGSQVSGVIQEDLLAALESILILTQEVAQRLPVLQQHPDEWRMHILDQLQWEWAAKAHYAVAQLQAWKGGHTEAWKLLIQCLKPSDGMAKSLEHRPSEPQPHHGACASGAGGVNSVDSWGVTPTATLGCSLRTYSADPVITKTNAADLDTQQHHVPPSSRGSVACLHAKLDQPLPEEGSVDSGNRIAKITQEMAKEVFLMAQSLRRRGHILTKDQLIASARRIASSGQNFSKLVRIIAKNCIDQRCSQELLCLVEQIQTVSNQLRIISSVKASLARSKSSEELLVENAQLLLRAVSKTVRAAEAASLRGLRQPYPDPEELEVAAFCRQWRRKLLRYRIQETSNLDCDELGLRKTSKKEPPTLAALVQET
ncbi:Catenin alpha-2, partial [Galemys pyrenaicus]